MAAKGFRATSLLPCDSNIFRPHDFPLASENTEAAPVNHSALAKTSDQPSFSSVNFSPFTSAGAFRASDIRPVTSLNLQPNPRGGSLKKITDLSYRNFVEATQQNNIKRATKSKTNRLSNALLGPSKRRKKVVCRDATPSDTRSDSDTDQTVPFADDSIQEEEREAYCVFCTGRFFEDHSVEEWIQCAKYDIFQKGAHTLCWYGRRVCL
jgi:hypothetical protein